MKNKTYTATLYAIGAAALYALNIPISKILLKTVSPTMMAALLYLGAGLGIGLINVARQRKTNSESKLTKKELPYTICMILLDIAAPILLMMGLKLSTAENASLLGNFEIVATSLIAMVFFSEKVSNRLWIAISLVTLSSVILSLESAASLKFSTGSLLVLGACIFWGLENNCTRKLSSKSTAQIVTLKGLFSGIGSFAIAISLGESLPRIPFIGAALLLGFAAYGLSIFLYIRAQRDIGAAKTSAYYAAAPFIGVILSFILFRDEVTLQFFIALAVMIVGTYFVITDTIALQHTHAHLHAHSHEHEHDGVMHLHEHTHEHSHLHTHADTSGAEHLHDHTQTEDHNHQH